MLSVISIIMLTDLECHRNLASVGVHEVDHSTSTATVGRRLMRQILYGEKMVFGEVPTDCWMSFAPCIDASRS